jgi:uncharacterized membrane protein
MMNGVNHGWGMGLGVGWIIGLFILVVFIWILVEINKRYSNSNHKTAEDILKERNAFVK